MLNQYYLTLCVNTRKSQEKNRKYEFLMISLKDRMFWILRYRGVVRVIVALAGGRSLLRCTVWAAAVRLWQHYITQSGWMYSGARVMALAWLLSTTLFLSPLRSPPLLLFWLSVNVSFLSPFSPVILAFVLWDPNATLFSLFLQTPGGVSSHARQRCGNSKRRKWFPELLWCQDLKNLINVKKCTNKPIR